MLSSEVNFFGKRLAYIYVLSHLETMISNSAMAAFLPLS